MPGHDRGKFITGQWRRLLNGVCGSPISARCSFCTYPLVCHLGRIVGASIDGRAFHPNWHSLDDARVLLHEAPKPLIFKFILWRIRHVRTPSSLIVTPLNSPKQGFLCLGKCLVASVAVGEHHASARISIYPRLSVLSDNQYSTVRKIDRNTSGAQSH